MRKKRSPKKVPGSAAPTADSTRLAEMRKKRSPKKVPAKVRRIVALLEQVPVEDRAAILDEAIDRVRVEVWDLIVGRKARGR